MPEDFGPGWCAVSRQHVARPVWPVATRTSKLTARRLVITFVPTPSRKLVRHVGWRDDLTSRGYTRTVHGVGDLVPGIDGSWMVRPPERCANGHRLRGRCIVGTTPCSCQDRHLSWTCDLCGDTTYGPALGPDCNVLDGRVDGAAS